jgi:hypothetical protein
MKSQGAEALPFGVRGCGAARFCASSTVALLAWCLLSAHSVALDQKQVDEVNNELFKGLKLRGFARDAEQAFSKPPFDPVSMVFKPPQSRRLSLPQPINGTNEFVLTKSVSASGKDQLGRFRVEVDFFTDSVLREVIETGRSSEKTNITANQSIVLRLIRSYLGDELHKEELKTAVIQKFGKPNGSLEGDAESLIWVYPTPSWSFLRFIFGQSCPAAQKVANITGPFELDMINTGSVCGPRL